MCHDYRDYRLEEEVKKALREDAEKQSRKDNALRTDEERATNDSSRLVLTDT